jgi:hypothetical protein
MEVCSLCLWERVGVRGYGLSTSMPPHPDRQRDMAEASLRRSYLETAAEDGPCLSPLRRATENHRALTKQWSDR